MFPLGPGWAPARANGGPFVTGTGLIPKWTPMRRLLALASATALLLASTAGLAAPAYADPAQCLTACTVTFTPSDGQVAWTIPSRAVGVRLTVAGGEGSIYEGDRGGAGGSGGTITTGLGYAYGGQTLHLLAGAVGTAGPSHGFPFSPGGGGSYVAVSGQFIAVAGGGGGGGMQLATLRAFGDPFGSSLPQVNLKGGAGGYSGASPDGASGSDNNDAQAYGTGAVGAVAGTGSWSTPGDGRNIMAGGPGTVAAVSANGTITPGTGGGWTFTGQGYSGAAEGGGGFAGGGGGSAVGQTLDYPDRSSLITSTPGPGGGGSGYLAAGLTAISTGPNTGDGHITITYSIAQVPSVPGAPTGLTAIPDPVSGGAKLSWTDPADTASFDIMGYVLERSENGIGWTEVAPNSALTSPFLDDNLIQGTTYQWRVAAVNADGTGPFSGTTSMLSQRYPGTGVTDFAAKPGDRSTTLTWGYPDDDGGTPITGYQVQYAVTDDPWSAPEGLWIDASITTAMSYTVTNLDNDTWYGFRIRPINAQGPASGGWSRKVAFPHVPYVNFNFMPNFTTPAGAQLHGSTVAPGTEIVVSQSGLPIGAKLTVTLWNSNGWNLVGTAIVDGTGSVRLSMRIPADAPDGEYVMSSDLTDAGHPVLAVSAYFDVKAASAANSSSGKTAAPVAAVTTAVPAATAGLANTGATTTWIASLGTLLLMAGFASRLVARRRRA